MSQAQRPVFRMTCKEGVTRCSMQEWLNPSVSRMLSLTYPVGVILRSYRSFISAAQPLYHRRCQLSARKGPAASSHTLQTSSCPANQLPHICRCASSCRSDVHDCLSRVLESTASRAIRRQPARTFEDLRLGLGDVLWESPCTWKSPCSWAYPHEGPEPGIIKPRCKEFSINMNRRFVGVQGLCH